MQETTYTNKDTRNTDASSNKYYIAELRNAYLRMSHTAYSKISNKDAKI